MAGTATEVHEITTDEVRNVGVSLSGLLGDGETLIGSPEIQSDDSITITNGQINSTSVTINNQSVADGKVVLFTVACSKVGSFYIEIKCSTDANQVLEAYIKVKVTRSRF